MSSITDVFGIATIVLTGVGVSFFLVSQFVYKSMRDEGKKHIDEERNEIRNYEKKYYEEFSNLKIRNLSEEEKENLKYCFVRENTPVTEVIMTYNNNTKSFWYYASTKNISYKILDSLAQNFVLQNDCKEICIDYHEELNKLKCKENPETSENKDDTETSEISETSENKDDTEKNKKSSIYATYKSYNKSNDVRNIPKPLKYEKKINRFTYKGKLYEWTDPNKKDMNETKTQKIDYETFKRNQKIKSL